MLINQQQIKIIINKQRQAPFKVKNAPWTNQNKMDMKMNKKK